jgi:hypothetical protein
MTLTGTRINSRPLIKSKGKEATVSDRAMMMLTNKAALMALMITFKREKLALPL